MLMDSGLGDGEADKLIKSEIRQGSIFANSAGMLMAAEAFGTTAPAVACLDEPGLRGSEAACAERLTAAQRRALPAKSFAWPEKDGYPLDTPERARSAMQRLNQYYAQGRYTDADYLRVRSNILKAYARYGITPRAPSLVQAASGRPGLALAAEPQPREAHMLTKAEKKAIAMKNLRKAWAKQGAHAGKGAGHKAREVAEPGKGKGKGGGKGGGKGAGKGAAHPSRKPATAPRAASGKGHGKGAGKAGPAKPPMTPERRREIAIQNLRKAWESPKLGRPAAGPAAPRPAARPAHPGPSAHPGATGKGAGHKPRPPRIPPGKYIDPRTGAMLRIQRVFPSHNPDAGVGEYIAAGTSFVVFLTGTDLFFRWWVTRPAKDQKTALHGASAAAAIRSRLGAGPLAIGFGAALVLGAAAYFGRNYNYVLYPVAAASAGIGVRVVQGAIQDVLLPLVFKAQSPSEETVSNRLLADKQDWMQQGATAALNPPAGGTTKTGADGETVFYGDNPPVGTAAGPQWVPPAMPQMPKPAPSAPSSDIGPSAEVGVGCGGGGCGGMTPGVRTGYGACPTCKTCGRTPAPGTKCSCGLPARPGPAPGAVPIPTQPGTPAQPGATPTNPIGEVAQPEGPGADVIEMSDLARIIRGRRIDPNLLRRASRAFASRG